MGANAQTSVPTFAAGEVLTAANMNISARTGVPVFATTADRDAAFGGTGEKTLAEGQMCYIEAAPKRLQVYNGTAFIDFDAQYTTFTPTFTNYTRGNGTSSSSFVRIGTTVVVNVFETLGSTSSVSGLLRLTLPVAASATGHINAQCLLGDAGTAQFAGQIDPLASTSFIELFANGATGTYVNAVATSATVPHTWATNDRIIVNAVYEIA